MIVGEHAVPTTHSGRVSFEKNESCCSSFTTMPMMRFQRKSGVAWWLLWCQGVIQVSLVVAWSAKGAFVGIRRPDLSPRTVDRIAHEAISADFCQPDSAAPRRTISQALRTLSSIFVFPRLRKSWTFASEAADSAHSQPQDPCTACLQNRFVAMTLDPPAEINLSKSTLEKLLQSAYRVRS
jgi:hypothetical protein